eukprot:1156725-Pelagomonas_calceolata.AAC.5
MGRRAVARLAEKHGDAIACWGACWCNNLLVHQPLQNVPLLCAHCIPLPSSLSRTVHPLAQQLVKNSAPPCPAACQEHAPPCPAACQEQCTPLPSSLTRTVHPLAQQLVKNSAPPCPAACQDQCRPSPWLLRISEGAVRLTSTEREAPFQTPMALSCPVQDMMLPLFDHLRHMAKLPKGEAPIRRLAIFQCGASVLCALQSVLTLLEGASLSLGTLLCTLTALARHA